MPLNPKKSAATKTAQLAVYGSQAGSNAVIELYDGTQPTSPDAAYNSGGAANLLASSAVTGALIFTNTGGVLTFSPIGDTTGTAACTLSGKTATWGRLRSSAAGVSGLGVLDFAVGATGCDMNLSPDALIKTGQTFSIPNFVINAAN